MMFIRWMVLVVLLVVLTVTSSSNPQQHFTVHEVQEDTVYDTVDVHYISSVTRHKRSKILPQKMLFHLKSAKTNIKVRLKRAPQLNIPTYVSQYGSIQQVYIPDYQTSGVYVDQYNGQALLVTNRIGGYYDLVGNVMVNNNQLSLQPQGGGRHKLTSGMMISFGADEVFGNPQEYVSLYQMKSAIQQRKQRYKRAATSYAVELLAVTDYTIKNRFLARNSGSEDLANSEIKAYYTFMIFGMSERYATIANHEAEVMMSIDGAGIVISNTADDAPYHQASNKNGMLEYITALSTFTDWVSSNAAKNVLPAHDHAMWFTDDSLAVGKSTSVIGVAWVGTMCSKNSTSIVEEYFTGRTEQIAAHELGHSLNAVHDGDVKGCSNNDAYVMAASSYFPEDDRRSHPWIFSSCSALYIAYYAPHFKCLSETSGSASMSSAALPGQYLNADEQCRISEANADSYFCRNEQKENFGFSLMCQRMYCFNPSESTCQTVIAKDFTSCGSGMWCDHGDCVAASAAPVTSDNCPQGDNKAANCNLENCGSYDTRQLVNCCQTCVGLVMAQPTNNNINNNNNNNNNKANNKAVVANNYQSNASQCPMNDYFCRYCRADQKRMKTQQCAIYN